VYQLNVVLDILVNVSNNVLEMGQTMC